MAYTTIFKDTDVLSNNDFCCVKFKEEGVVKLCGNNTFLMVFVMQGSLKITFLRHISQVIEAGQLLVVDLESLIEVSSTANTVLFNYSPPKRLNTFFYKTAKAFQSDYSTIVPILPELQVWIDSMIVEFLPNPQDDLSIRERRIQLAKILLRYPRTVMGELFVPFLACASNSCSACMCSADTQEKPK